MVDVKPIEPKPAAVLAPPGQPIYARVMMDTFRNFMTALLLALLLSPAAMADEAQDKQVKIGVAAYDDGDYARAKAILLPLAEAGHPKAMNMVGLMTKFGNAFTPNLEVACNWYEKSATAGYPSAMYNMSICYDGFGRPDDPETDKFWLLKAADAGNIPAMINLASLDSSKGTEYRRWMMMAQDHGNAWAKVDLWLQGYKDDSQMNLRDFVCVTWNITIMDGRFEDCD